MGVVFEGKASLINVKFTVLFEVEKQEMADLAQCCGEWMLMAGIIS